MNLDDATKQTVATWIEEGLKLSEIQSRLASELGIRMTYMEVRFLMDDLKLKPKDKEVPAAPVSSQPSAGLQQTGPDQEVPAGQDIHDSPQDMAGTPGRVLVTVDQVTRPGSLVSGKVTFTDGNSAEWYLDQMGRLGLVPKSPGYRPPQSDLASFQAELQNELARMGL